MRFIRNASETMKRTALVVLSVLIGSIATPASADSDSSRHNRAHSRCDDEAILVAEAVREQLLPQPP
jgi:hypothetical protein